MLGAAVSSIARWETSGPPRGNTLLRLAKFAQRNAIGKVKDIFVAVYLDEVIADVGVRVVLNHAREAQSLKKNGRPRAKGSRSN